MSNDEKRLGFVQTPCGPVVIEFNGNILEHCELVGVEEPDEDGTAIAHMEGVIPEPIEFITISFPLAPSDPKCVENMHRLAAERGWPMGEENDG